MEDVLAVYHRHYEDNEVLVCLDETSKQQVKETRLPRPPRPGAPLAYDYDYERNGVSNLFMLFAPLEALRQAQEAASGGDGPAQESRLGGGGQETVGRGLPGQGPDRLGDGQFEASLYETFEPTEARRIAERLEIHYTPKHGSWLNMEEI